MIRVLLMGDTVLFRGALAQALAGEQDLHVVADVGRARHAGDAPAEPPTADVAIVDLETPSGNFPSTPGWAGALTCPVVALTGRLAQKALRYAETHGVHGLVAKDRGLRHLVDTIRRVAGGERVIDLGPKPRAATANPLTEREIDILRLMAEGKSIVHVAWDLDLTVGTVRNYLSSIVHKTGARTSLEAISAADRAGWL
jgi:two-component system response regulator DesR